MVLRWRALVAASAALAAFLWAVAHVGRGTLGTSGAEWVLTARGCPLQCVPRVGGELDAASAEVPGRAPRGRAGEQPAFVHEADGPCGRPTYPPGSWNLPAAEYGGDRPACFDYSRCGGAPGSALAVYVYPNSSATPDYYARDRRQYREILRELRSIGSWGVGELRLVDRPEDACLLVPNVDASCEHNACGPEDVGAALGRLPHWNGGRNHLVWEISDWEVPHYDSGHALRVRSNFPRRLYRRGRDVSYPLFPFYMHDGEWPEAGERRSAADRARPPQERSVLAAFKGQLPHHMDNPRHALARLNDSDVVVVPYCCKSPWCRPPGADCAGMEQRRDARDFDALMRDTKFALVPRGYGLHSYRLWESLHAGAVPVVIADGWVLPFEDDIDWESCAVLVREDEIAGLPDRLRALAAKPGALEAMQTAGRYAFDAFFADRRSMLQQALLTVRRRAQCLGVCGGSGAGLRVSWSPLWETAEAAKADRSRTK